jgi:ACS family hexuronate transporter-like MFS transporter
MNLSTNTVGETSSNTAKKKIVGLRWWIIGVVMLGTILNYLTRSSLSAAAPTLKQELSITVEQYSYVVAAFQACYTVMQPIAGYILDSIGVKIGLAIFCIAWSVTNMLHGFAGSWQSLAFFRGLMGMAEAAVIPAGLKAVTEWFPAKERSIATGWFNIGSSIGGMMAPPLVIACISYYNWQTAFVVTGALGFFWVALWLMFFRSPAEHPQITDEEKQYILDGQEASHKNDTSKPSVKQIVSRREFWAIAIPKFLAEPAWQTFNFWIPLYLSTVRHMDLKSIAMFAWIPFLAADMGCIVGGYLSPLMIKYFKVSILTSRKLVVVTGATCMLAPAAIGMVASPYAAIALFCVGTFAHQTISGSLITMSSDVFPRNSVGTANGLTGMAGYLGATIFSFIVGIVASKIGYDPLFVCLSLFDIIGAIVVCLMLKQSAMPTLPTAKSAA